ncbi:MAG: hypothetical protein WCC03_12465 [Candidatus Acidiferrales bacterium]
MSHLVKTLLRAAFAMLLAAATANAQDPNPTPSPDQRPRQCAGTIDVGGQTANPFTAKRTTKATTILPDGTKKLTELVQFVARDSDGRIRLERHGGFQPAGDTEKFVLHTRDGGQIETTRETIGISILIFDCPASEMIQIQPGMQIAHVTKQSPRPTPNRPLPPFSIRITSLLSGKPRPDVSVEDLGYREIEGISARGVRLTNLGTESDGNWNGKPIRITETWASDDLAATILEILSDPRKQMEDITTLTDIKRGEPVHSLFEIPPGYKINPTPDEMPFEMAEDSGHPIVTDPKK